MTPDAPPRAAGEPRDDHTAAARGARAMVLVEYVLAASLVLAVVLSVRGGLFDAGVTAVAEWWTANIADPLRVDSA